MNRFVIPSLLLILASGCGDDPAAAPDAAPDAAIDAAPQPDAFVPDARPPAALDCLGDPSPTTADDPIVFSANAFTVGVGGGSAVPNATIDVLSKADPMGTPLATGTSDANGDAALSVATGGLPLDVFVRATPPNTQLTTELFFPDVVSANIQAPSILLGADGVGLLAQSAGQAQDFGTNGFGVVLVLDCAGTPILGATVTSPSGTVVYAGSMILPDTNLDATSEAGSAYIFNLTPGEDLIFDAEVDGMSLRDNTARVVVGQIVSLAIQP